MINFGKRLNNNKNFLNFKGEKAAEAYLKCVDCERG